MARQHLSWRRKALLIGLPIVVAACATAQQSGGPGGMSFFVTSVGGSKGADLGGLAGADRHCQTLAAAAGAGSKTWRAYLSTQGKDNVPTVNARDRIGKGPWTNIKGVVVGNNVDHLHSANNNVTQLTALNEKGGTVEGRSDTPPATTS